MAQQQHDSISIVTGKAVPRIDGPLKVSGQAMYTSDMNIEGMVYAVPVGSTIAKGKVRSIDSSAAEKMKGVLGVFTKKNIGPLYRPAPGDGFASRIDEARAPFEDDVVRYYGQYVACVVAETFEIAQAAAHSLKISYSTEKPNLDPNMKPEDVKKQDTKRGDPDSALAKAAVKVDHEYTIPSEVHNAIELHATVAHWEGEKITLYETSQAIGTHQNVIAQILGIPKENVRVVTKFLGSGFGGKLWLWQHSSLAAATARQLKRPVKLVIERKQSFTNVGYRPRTQQRIRLGADASGRLQSLQHDYVSQASMLDDYKENCGEVSGSLYKVENCEVNGAVARRNFGTPTSMRGPGAVPGLFALESAMDELAIACKIDPVQLRIINDTDTDMSTGSKYSSRHFVECLELGSKKFGWAKRNAAVGSMKDGDEILGWGVAACTWIAKKLDAQLSIEMTADGRVRVNCATHDIGTGMYTVIAQVTSDELGLPISKIEVHLGDTSLPPGPLAGGSMATASMVDPIIKAVKEIKSRLIGAASKLEASPLHGEKKEDLVFEKGVIKSTKTKKSIEYLKLMEKANLAIVSGVGDGKGTMGASEKGKPATKSFGAHFVEIGWNPKLAKLRVRRVVSVIDAGRIINYQPAKNQIEGAIIMGIGMGMLEQAEIDMRYGEPINRNLADYIMAVHADAPQIDVTFLDYPDKALNEWGARGVGEIGLAGLAPAITAAVHHATGVRVRELPATIEKLIAAKA